MYTGRALFFSTLYNNKLYVALQDVYVDCNLRARRNPSMTELVEESVYSIIGATSAFL